MTAPAFEQRNAYRGSPGRAWVAVRLLAPDGSTRELDLLADTGSPCEVVLGEQVFRQFRWLLAPDVNTNFGVLTGGWVHVRMPELEIDTRVVGYGSDAIAQGVWASSPKFEGLAGLPFLRRTEYGGDASSFWLRPLAGTP